jgi:hypothetical protein
LIPGGQAYGANRGGSTHLNLVFTRGPYFYLLSVTRPAGRQNGTNLFDLIIAANHLYARVPR